jgi:hypothetical protein
MNLATFDGLTAWFSTSVDDTLKRLWKAQGGTVADNAKATFFFSDDASTSDTKKLLKARPNSACIVRSHYIVLSHRAMKLQPLTAHLLPLTANSGVAAYLKGRGVVGNGGGGTGNSTGRLDVAGLDALEANGDGAFVAAPAMRATFNIPTSSSSSKAAGKSKRGAKKGSAKKAAHPSSGNLFANLPVMRAPPTSLYVLLPYSDPANSTVYTTNTTFLLRGEEAPASGVNGVEDSDEDEDDGAATKKAATAKKKAAAAAAAAKKKKAAAAAAKKKATAAAKRTVAAKKKATAKKPAVKKGATTKKKSAAQKRSTKKKAAPKSKVTAKAATKKKKTKTGGVKRKAVTAKRAVSTATKRAKAAKTSSTQTTRSTRSSQS